MTDLISLNKLKCPGCLSHGPFRIQVRATLVVSHPDTFTSPRLQHEEYGAESFCSCEECGVQEDLYYFLPEKERAG